MTTPTLIFVLADYGKGDLAFGEVTQQLLLRLPSAQIQTFSVPSFDTLATGFWNAQLGLNSGPKERLIYHNCAPRKDNLNARTNNEGEALTYALLENGVTVIGVNAGYTLSFIKNHAKTLRVVNIPKSGSQFRSRDTFPEAVSLLTAGDESLLGDAINPEGIPDIPKNQIAWVDGYGNIKTTIALDGLELLPGETISVQIGMVRAEAIFADGSFSVPEGTLAFSSGSSGWSSADGTHKICWIELFLRGGNAWERFNRPEIGSKIIYGPLRSRKVEPLTALTYSI